MDFEICKIRQPRERRTVIDKNVLNRAARFLARNPKCFDPMLAPIPSFFSALTGLLPASTESRRPSTETDSRSTEYSLSATLLTISSTWDPRGSATCPRVSRTSSSTSPEYTRPSDLLTLISSFVRTAIFMPESIVPPDCAPATPANGNRKSRAATTSERDEVRRCSVRSGFLFVITCSFIHRHSVRSQSAGRQNGGGLISRQHFVYSQLSNPGARQSECGHALTRQGVFSPLDHLQVS